MVINAIDELIVLSRSRVDLDRLNLEIRLDHYDNGLVSCVLGELSKKCLCDITLYIHSTQGSDLPDCDLLNSLHGWGLRALHAELSLDKRDPQKTVREILFLRTCSELNIPLFWTPPESTDVLFDALTHLPPPVVGEGETEGWSKGWREAYAEDGLLYRRGPGFVLVQDLRPATGPVIYELREESVVFLSTREPQTVQNLKAIHGACATNQLANLIQASLLLRLTDWVINLACRPNTKAVPYGW